MQFGVLAGACLFLDTHWPSCSSVLALRLDKRFSCVVLVATR
jgi:hypothetical protein